MKEWCISRPDVVEQLATMYHLDAQSPLYTVLPSLLNLKSKFESTNIRNSVQFTLL